MKPSTFTELSKEYKASPNYVASAPLTKVSYLHLLGELEKVSNDIPVLYWGHTENGHNHTQAWFKGIQSLSDSNHKRNKLRAMLNTVFLWGSKNLEVAFNPAINIPTLRHEISETNPFTPDDIELINARLLKTGYYTPTKKLVWISEIVKFLFETGMRPSEMFNLKLDNVIVDGDDSFLAIMGAKGREEGKVSRYTYITPSVKRFLGFMSDHRSSSKAKGDSLVVSLRGCTIETPGLNKVFHHLMTELGLKGKKVYDLRRGCATEIINNPKYGVHVAQQQLGHKDIKTTLRYEKLDKKRAALLYRG